MTKKQDNDLSSKSPVRTELADKTKKLGKLTVNIRQTIGEEKGSFVETHEVIDHGQVVARYVKKDDEVVEGSATADAQAAGIHEKAAKQAGMDKKDVVFTDAGEMAAAAAVFAQGDESNRKASDTKAELSGKTKEKKPKSKPSEGKKPDASMSKMAKEKTGVSDKSGDRDLSKDLEKADKIIDLAERRRRAEEVIKRSGRSNMLNLFMALKGLSAGPSQNYDTAKTDAPTTKVSVEPHPPEVIDVDPKVIDGMKDRLKKSPDKKRHAYGTNPEQARSDLASYEKTAQRILAGVSGSKAKAGQKKKVESKVKRMLKYFQDGVHYADAVHQVKNDPNAPAPFLSDSNSKLIKDGIISFNLPAGHTCPGKGDCFGICYAMQGPQSWPDAMKKRVHNWGSAERPDFVERMNAELSRWPKKSKNSKTGQVGNIVRIHDSGDFYSQEYIDKWHQIATANPDKHFYAYTKALDLDWKKLHALPNFTVIQSVGGKNDHLIDPSLPHSYIFPTPEAMHAAGYVDTHESDMPAANSKKSPKIGLVVHGIFSKQHDSDKYGKEFGSKMKKSSGIYHLSGDQIPGAYRFDQPDHVSQLDHSSHPADRMLMMALSLGKDSAPDAQPEKLVKAKQEQYYSPRGKRYIREERRMAPKDPLATKKPGSNLPQGAAGKMFDVVKAARSSKLAKDGAYSGTASQKAAEDIKTSGGFGGGDSGGGLLSGVAGFIKDQLSPANSMGAKINQAGAASMGKALPAPAAPSKPLPPPPTVTQAPKKPKKPGEVTYSAPKAPEFAISKSTSWGHSRVDSLEKEAKWPVPGKVPPKMPERPAKQMAKAAPKGVDEAKYKRCKEDVAAKQGGSETKPYNVYAVCASALKKATNGLRAGMPKGEHQPHPGPSVPRWAEKVYSTPEKKPDEKPPVKKDGEKLEKDVVDLKSGKKIRATQKRKEAQRPAPAHGTTLPEKKRRDDELRLREESRAKIAATLASPDFVDLADEFRQEHSRQDAASRSITPPPPRKFGEPSPNAWPAGSRAERVRATLDKIGGLMTALKVAHATKHTGNLDEEASRKASVTRIDDKPASKPTASKPEGYDFSSIMKQNAEKKAKQAEDIKNQDIKGKIKRSPERV